ncbi:MAG: dihydroorotase [Deltaproteobacteria bacterium]|nr:dihydroorotase [Deltaproteobacteria bacterium]
MHLLITGGLVVDPAQNLEAPRDLLIVDGRIAAVELPGAIPSEGREVLDAAGLVVVPGLIDMHVHLREPGEEYKETVETGTRAAVRGGFTGVASMPNTKPVNDTAAVTRFILDQARAAGLARVHPVGAISVGSRGEALCEYAELKAAGCAAVSDDGRPVMDALLMRRALEYARTFELLVISHAEDLHLRADGVMHEGPVSTRLGLRGIPAAAEEVMVFRDVTLAALTGARLHIAHVSTAGSVEIIRRAKARGAPVTCETAPHYFTLTDEAVCGQTPDAALNPAYDTNAKVNPPLRTAADVAAVQEGLRDGAIDAIACDHAPHGLLEKDVEFAAAAMGLIGLETSLGLSLKLVHEGILTLGQLIARMSTHPARILGVPGGALTVGAPADLTLIDLEREWTVAVNAFASRSRNCPFEGWQLTGKAVAALVGGRLVHQELDV